MMSLLYKYWYLLLIVSLPFANQQLHLVYFVRLPKRVNRKYGETDPDRLQKYLKRVLATPSLLGPSIKIFARYILAGSCFRQGELHEAAIHFRENLDVLAKSTTPERERALAGDMRRRLADCLESFGKVEEAATQRRLAAEGLDQAPADALRYLTRGTLLERENKHDEAYAAFEKAFELTHESHREVRIECAGHLTIAAYNVGRPLDSISLKIAGNSQAPLSISAPSSSGRQRGTFSMRPPPVT